MEYFFTNLVDKTVGSLGRRVRYLRDYNHNIADLRNQLQVLKESREAVKRRVNIAKQRGNVIIPEVEEWLARVDTVIRDYDELLRPEEFEENRFIDLKSRYKVSTKAKEGILLADRLQREFNFIRLYVPAPPPAPTRDFTLMRDLGVFESRRPIYEAIIKALQGDEISIIGVYGMAGVGKTTLVREIAKYAEFNHLFDEIVMAVVSPTPNIRKIQGEIADALGLQFEVESDYGRAGCLYARIKNVKRILVILDDLRTALALEAIGIPHGDAHEGCKIVLTSRELDVCHQMNAQTSNCIQVLSESEAWTLFEKTAINIEEVPDVLPVAQKVAKECGGLPVAIISVAKALRGKNDIVWKDALSKLKKSEGLHDHISRALKLSYELLETEQLKTCFLLCSLFPEDSDIPIEYLVRYGLGLRWYRNVDSLIEARFSAHKMIDELKACGLLLDGIDKGSTRMHAVVRDFAISVASGGEHAFLVRAGSGGVTGWPNVEALNQYKVISLIGNCIKKSPPNGLVCPNLEMLLLQCDSDSVEMPNQFFKGMKKLRVLHLRRMSIPLSLGYLKKLRTLCLDCCKIPDDLCDIKELEDLEILSIVDSDIEELPSAVGQLSKLRLLDLAYCKKLKVISPGILARLTQLEGLYMRNSFKDWAGHGQDYNASLTELKALSSLKVLEMHIPDAELYPKDLLLDKLTEFKITIGGEFDWHDIYSYSRNLKLENLSDTLEGGGVNMLLTRAELVFLKDLMVEQNVLFDLTQHDFRNLRVVTVFDCDKLKSLYRHIMGRGIGQLRELDVRSCSNMEAILEEDGGTVAQEDGIVFSDLKSLKLIGLPNLMSFLDGCLHEPLFHRKVVFPSLEELFLWGLDNMEEIWYKHLLPAQSFYSLRDLSVGSCEKLITVIPSNLSGRLNVLAKFSVWDCDLVQEICEGYDASSLILPHISVLRLRGLPKLEHIWWNKVSRNFISLQNIKILRIYRCKSLRYVFSVSVSKDLGQLETLAVEKCDMMKAIIADEGQEKIEAVKRIVFPKLHTLELKDMELLTSFYQGDCNLEFGSLEILRIEKCPLLKTFTGNPKEANATAQPFGGEQSPITPDLHFTESRSLPGSSTRPFQSILRVRSFEESPITPELYFTKSRSWPGSLTRPFQSIIPLRSFGESPITPELHFTESRSLSVSSTSPFQSILRLPSFSFEESPITPELHFTESRSLPGSSARPFESILRVRSFEVSLITP